MSAVGSVAFTLLLGCVLTAVLVTLVYEVYVLGRAWITRPANS